MASNYFTFFIVLQRSYLNVYLVILFVSDYGMNNWKYAMGKQRGKQAAWTQMLVGFSLFKSQKTNPNPKQEKSKIM